MNAILFLSTKRQLFVPLCLFIFTLALLVIASNYTLGKLSSLGAGFFPCFICSILILLTLLQLKIQSIEPTPKTTEPTRNESKPKSNFPVALIYAPCGIVLWGLLVDGTGFFIASSILLLFSNTAMNSSRNTRNELLILLAKNLGILIFCFILFIKILGLPL
jgi:Na+/melibiose symporter-like transporter